MSLYSNYRWMPELTIPLAARIVEHLGVPRGARVLDFGCAKGYLVKALRLLGRDAYGCDTSTYALQHAPTDVSPFLFPTLHGTYDWVLAKDVLEHLDYDEIGVVLNRLRAAADHLFAVIPMGHAGQYAVPAYEQDATHVIREGLEWWCARFLDGGWEVQMAEYRVEGIKDNWAEWPRGNGFLTARRAV